MVGRGAAPAKARRTELAARQFMRLQIRGAVHHVLEKLCLIETSLHGATVIVVTRIAADG